MCGIGQVTPSASWARGTNSSNPGDLAFTSLWGLCKQDQEAGNPTCTSWHDLSVNNNQCQDPTRLQEPDQTFYVQVCRGYALEHWHGFTLVVSFFINLGLLALFIARCVHDTKNRRKTSMILAILLWLFLVLSWGGYSANCFPGHWAPQNDYAWNFTPGTGLASAISAWAFTFFIIPVAVFVNPNKPRNDAEVPVTFP